MNAGHAPCGVVVTRGSYGSVIRLLPSVVIVEDLLEVGVVILCEALAQF